MDTAIQQPVFPIPLNAQKHAQTLSQRYSRQWARWNSYLNQLCLGTLLPWLQTEYDPQTKLLFHRWEDTNGSAIVLRQKRLILIPDLSLDMSEIRVPQIWVDDSNDAGDYYLAVQVDPDDLWVQLWGYTVHQHIKTLGEYDAYEGCYYLAMEHLVLDMNVFGVVQLLCPNESTRFNSKSA